MVLTPEDLGRVDVSLEIESRRPTVRSSGLRQSRGCGRSERPRRRTAPPASGRGLPAVAGDALEFSQRDPSSGFGGGAFERQPERNAPSLGAARVAAQADMSVVPAPGAWTSLSLTPDRVDLKV
ncbi:MAG: hypothetical protein ACWGHP_10870 [Stenotrophomonas sp.]